MCDESYRVDMIWEKVYDHGKAMAQYYLANITFGKVFLSFIIIMAFLMFWHRVFRHKPPLWYILLVSIYLTIVASVTLLGRSGVGYNGLETIFLTYQMLGSANPVAYYEVFFNILLFVPAGILFSIRYRWKKSIAMILGLTVLIEILQLVTAKGLFEVSDIINNTIGGLIGVGIIALCKFNKANG